MQEVKNRPIKELLQLMLDNIDRLERGLCLLSVRLYGNDLISEKEALKIRRYLRENKPNISMHWFPIGKKQPRIEWLQQQIKKKG